MNKKFITRKFAYLILALLLLICAAGGCSDKDVDDGTNMDNEEQNAENQDAGEQDETNETEYIGGMEVISAETLNTFSSDNMRLFGRTYVNSKQLYLDNTATGAELCFYGTQLTASIVSGASTMYLRVFCDGDEGTLLPIAGNKTYTLAQFEEEDVHTVRVLKATSSQHGSIGIKSFSTDGKFLKAAEKQNLQIEFVGDSITAGAGIFASSTQSCTVDNSDATKSYAYLTGQALDADCSLVATEGICVKAKSALNVNMYEMYEYYSSLQHGKYSFPTEYDIVVVALGTNDGWYLSSHADYTVSDFAADYADLLSLIRSHQPNAQIVCVYGMMGTNASVTEGIENAIETLQDGKISYLALPSDTNGGEGHPSESGAAAQSEVLAAYLQEILL